jgi:hypothetical protein
MLKEEKQEGQLDKDVSFVTVMMIVHSMLKLDYTMQVNLYPMSVCLPFALMLPIPN